jgi:hypothetical protein
MLTAQKSPSEVQSGEIVEFLLMSHAGSPLRSNSSNDSNFLYQEPSSPRRSIEILLRNSHPNDMGLTFPPQSDSCSSIHIKLESSVVSEPVLEAVVARAYICLRSKGSMCVTLPKHQEEGNQDRPGENLAMQPQEVGLLCRMAGFVQIQVVETGQDYLVTCLKL